MGDGEARVSVWLGLGAAEEAGDLTSPLSGQAGRRLRSSYPPCLWQGRGSSSVQIDRLTSPETNQ